MANKILAKKADASIRKAVRDGMKDGKFTADELLGVLKAALDGGVVNDVEFRDLKRLLRTEKRLDEWDRMMIEDFLNLRYPLTGPFLYPGDLDALEGAAPIGSEQCAALVQVSQPIGLTSTWREGMRVEGNEHLIAKGTAVATFEDGFYPNRSHGNHVAYYISQDASGVTVMDQWTGKGSIASRLMRFKGKHNNGLYSDPSNNGSALSVIMKKA